MDIEQSIQAARELYQIDNLEGAEDVCRAILEARPDNAEALHLLGLILNKRGDHDRAAKNIRKAIKLNPNDADVYYDLGNILQDKGQITAAITNYRKAVKLNPQYVEAYNNMGIALQDSGRLDKAIASYKEALRIDPGYVDAHNNIGVAFQEKRQLDEAITHFQKALLLMPNYTDAYQNLVEAVQGKGYESKNKNKKQVVYAVYRCLYGEDFIQESIASINDSVDKIFVFWDDTPWGGVTGCVYKGEAVTFPRKFDHVVEKIKELKNPKIELIYDHQDTAENQLTHIVNDIILPKYEKPSIIVSLEVDHVFRRDQIKKAMKEFVDEDCVFATTHQIEVWKGLRHILPERPYKVGAVFCNVGKLDKMPSTLRHGGVLVMPKVSAVVHRFGFAASEKVMYWKHLLSIAAAQKSGEIGPPEDWYDEKWLKWRYEPDNGNLEIPEQDKTVLLKAIPHDVNELPEVMKGKPLI
jgi:Flp pilus assembly protein TadD